MNFAMSSHAVLELHRHLGAIVQLGKTVAQDEVSWSPGMIARITGIGLKHDMILAELDTRGFEEYNEPLFERNYYDAHQNPVLTAKEAGFWKDVDTWYLPEEQNWEDRMRFLAHTHPSLTDASCSNMQFSVSRDTHDVPHLLEKQEAAQLLSTALRHPLYQDQAFWLDYHQKIK